jgi:hypothetical protein
MKVEQTECSEMLALKLDTPVDNPKEGIQHSQYGESLKSRIVETCLTFWHRNLAFKF